ncbi:unnamed protein product [Owenia fusiformis]|uniref:Uncharacterized protein n=1 Tax=Owenia fusiformis TaxID=6347 RepID=A0A8J1TAM9_OWEFU|nr:unnamed protein product [Owenia fusiformis]
MSETLAVKVVQGIAFGVITCVSVFGNSLVIIAVYKNSNFRNAYNFYIVSLAISDLLVSVLVLPPNAIFTLQEKWILGPFLCQLWMMLDVMFCTASILNLCAISIDRLRAVVTPISYTTHKWSVGVIISLSIVWITSLIIGLLPIIIWTDTVVSRLNETEICELPVDPIFATVSSTFSFFVPCILIIICYIVILSALKKRLTEKMSKIGPTGITEDATTNVVDVDKEGVTTVSGKVATNVSLDDSSTQEQNAGGTTKNMKTKDAPKTNNSQIQAVYKREMKTMKTLGIVLAVFIICWMPFFVCNVINSVSGPVNMNLFIVVIWMGYINSMINPIIYSLKNKEYRKAFKSILRCG